ncbi:MAG: type IX secretion system membrane protein PorP/SprF [Draconibacterium sp.]
MKNKSANTQAKSAFLFIIFAIISFGLKAQEDTYWTGLSFKNPAAIATPSDWAYVDYSRSFNSTTQQDIELFVGSFDYKISQKAGTFGLDLSFGRYNYESGTLIKANYAYDIQVLESSILSFGISAGTTFYNNNLSDYIRYESADPNYVLPADIKYNILNGNLGMFLHSSRLSTGLSVTMKKQISGKDNSGNGFNFPSILTGVLAYRVVNNDYLTITPNIMADYSSNKFSWVSGLQLKYKNVVWAGYQNLDFEDAHSINLGVDVKTRFRIGFSYGFSDFFSTDGLNIQEIVLGYRLQ